MLVRQAAIEQRGDRDGGSTQTDSLDLERQRGITIKSAVVSFVVGDTTVNLIDTPGHPRRHRRGGAGAGRARRGAGAIAERLTPAVVAMGSVRGLATRDPRFVPYGAADDAFQARLADPARRSRRGVAGRLRRRRDGPPLPAAPPGAGRPDRRALIHPVFFGSAITGAGVDGLAAGITELLPAAAGDPGGPVSGTVFKVDRGSAGEKVAYLRLFSGTVRVRDRLAFAGRHGSHEGKVTAIEVFEDGGPCGGRRSRPGRSAGSGGWPRSRSAT